MYVVNIRNVKSIQLSFWTMRCLFVMFVTAVCFLFFLKLSYVLSLTNKLRAAVRQFRDGLSVPVILGVSLDKIKPVLLGAL